MWGRGSTARAPPSGPPPSKERVDRLRALHGLPPSAPLPPPTPTSEPASLTRNLSLMERACEDALQSARAAGSAAGPGGMSGVELAQQLVELQQRLEEITRAAAANSAEGG
eukprot:7381651-Prymnesium_polylepis.1